MEFSWLPHVNDLGTTQQPKSSQETIWEPSSSLEYQNKKEFEDIFYYSQCPQNTGQVEMSSTLGLSQLWYKFCLFHLIDLWVQYNSLIFPIFHFFISQARIIIPMKNVFIRLNERPCCGEIQGLRFGRYYALDKWYFPSLPAFRLYYS